MRFHALVFAGLALLPVAPLRGQAPPSIESVLEAERGIKNYSAVTISPDGASVAWVEAVEEKAGSGPRSAIWVAPARGGAAKRLTAGQDGENHREREVAWAPDSQSVAFLSDAAKEGQLQIYVASLSGAPPRQVTTLRGQLGHLRWSADGRSIAFLFVENSAQETGALVAYAPDSGPVEEKIEEQRIAIVDPASRAVRLVSPPDLYIYEYDWSADATSFAASGAHGSGTDNYWVAELFTIRANNGEAKSIWKPPLQIACPRWSPDGKSVAVIHGLMSDFGQTGGDVWIVPSGGGPAKDVTPGIASSPNELFFRGPREIVFSQQIDGEYGIASVDPATGNVRALWRGPEVVHVSLARQGRASAVVRSSFERAPQVAAGPIGEWTALTHENDGAKRFWSGAKSVHWESDGARVQGWLLAPQPLDPGRRYPLAVSVHGGPAAASGPGWPIRWNAVLPSQGYFVFLPNPRGSYGLGEAFTQGNVKDFGYGDLRDILSGVDQVLKEAPIDSRRVGILGWSYGGYMTMWAVTQTSRFRAAVAGAGVVDWRSYYGQNRIDQWMIPYFGKSVYEDPEVYAKSSPITFITKAKTPTLVLHGDRDSEVPTPQGYEFWHALKTLGVPTQLVIYENEGHGIRRPDHIQDIETRIVAWFDEYLKK